MMLANRGFPGWSCAGVDVGPTGSRTTVVLGSDAPFEIEHEAGAVGGDPFPAGANS